MCVNPVLTTEFNKNTLNYIIKNDLSPVKKSDIDYYSTFLSTYINLESIFLNHERHDEIIAITSHLTNILECFYYGDYTKVEQNMWQEIFKLNSENIKHSIEIFLDKIKNLPNNISPQKRVKMSFLKKMESMGVEIPARHYNPSLARAISLQDTTRFNVESFFV